MPNADPARGEPEPANPVEAQLDDSLQPRRLDETTPPPGAAVGGDQITVGNISEGVVAVGRGAQALVNHIDTYIQQVTERALTRAEEAEQARQLEHQQLAQAVKTYIQRLDKQASEAHQLPPDANPYKYVHAYEMPDADRFAGRDSVTELLLDRLVCADSRCRLVVLDGQARVGKTSLLMAGIVPVLVGAEHLPLYVPIRPSTSKPIATIIKESLLPDLSATPLLAQTPLRVFIRQVTEMLGDGKHLFVLLDGFEEAMTLPAEAHAAFREELAGCLFDSDPRDHWLISIDAARTSDLNLFFQPTISYPLANTLKVPLLNREEAREAILTPAKRRDLQISEPLVDMMVDDLGGDAVDPSYLQVLCFALVEALPPGESSLSVEFYKAQGGAAGVLGAFLNQTMGYLPPASREAGWHILSALLEARGGKAPREELVARLRLVGVRPGQTGHALDLLEAHGLLRQHEEAYELATEHFEARIRAWARAWAAERAVAEHIRTEFRRQTEHIVGSALRGLIGGALGFGLAYWIAFASQGLDYLWQLTLLRMLPGGLAGIVAILAVDLGLAGYSGRNERWLPWVWGGGGGALAFAMALPYHAFFGTLGLSPWQALQALLPAALEGALWGAVTGLGIVWVMRGERSWQHILPKVAIVCMVAGIVLWLADNGSVGNAFVMPDPPALLIAAGAIMPLCMITAAVLPGWTRE